MHRTFSKIKSSPHNDTTSPPTIKKLVFLNFICALLPTTSGLITPVKTSNARCSTPSLFANERRNDERNDRREILRTALLTPISLCTGLLVAPPTPSNAAAATPTGGGTDDGRGAESAATAPPRKNIPRKPYAPLEALLPATRVRYDIDRSAALAKEISSLPGDGGPAARPRREQITIALDRLLLGPKNYVVPLRQSSGAGEPSSAADAPDTAAAKKTERTNGGPKTRSGSKLYQRTYTDKLRSLPLTDVPLALLTTAGDYRQSTLLRNRQRALEGTNPTRAALNYYTRQLRFDTEFYVLTAGAEDRRRMIRNDSLPDIKSVIVSDLDLRDLVRNQILDGWEDCQAEFRYQVRRSGGGDTDGSTGFDAEELCNLLLKVQGHCDEWFAFIPANDVTEALDVVLKEDGSLL